MFELVRNKRFLQIVLAIIILPFAFFGIDSYFRESGGAQVVANVGSHKITLAEFQQALRDRQEMMRQLGGGDPARFDTAELRFAVLDGMILQRLLIDHAVRSGMTVSERQLQAIINEISGFQEEGRFSFERYQQFLKAQGMTPVSFENRLRQDVLTQHMSAAYAGSSFVPRTVAERLAKLNEEQREVSQVVISPERFLPEVKLEADAAKKYYDANQDEFRVPEQVRVDYVVLSAGVLLDQVRIDPAEVKKFYDEHASRFRVPEARQAGHILITAEGGAADARQKALGRAQELSQQLRQKPDRFPEFAKQHSRDPGSAGKGGDLGYLVRGTMKDVPQFEEKLFAMKVGEISEPVESSYGYHIIRLAGVRAEAGRSFDDVRREIDLELRKQQVARRFAELAENFNNTVFEQSDSLQPAAALLKAEVRRSGWVTRTRAEEPELNNPRLLQAVFSEDVLTNKRNTEAVEAAPGVLVAARVAEHRPASVQAFEDVKAATEKKLLQQRASQLAVQEGRALLEKIRKGEPVTLTWGAPQTVSRAEHKGYSEALLRQVYRINAASLPAHSGMERPEGGFVLLRLTRVNTPEKVTPENRRALSDALAQIVGQGQLSAYLESMKQKAKITIRKDLIESR